MVETVKIAIEATEWYPIFDAAQYTEDDAAWGSKAFEMSRADFEAYERAEAEFLMWQKRLAKLAQWDKDRDT